MDGVAGLGCCAPQPGKVQCQFLQAQTESACPAPPLTPCSPVPGLPHNVRFALLLAARWVCCKQKAASAFDEVQSAEQRHRTLAYLHLSSPAPRQHCCPVHNEPLCWLALSQLCDVPCAFIELQCLLLKHLPVDGCRAQDDDQGASLRHVSPLCFLPGQISIRHPRRPHHPNHLHRHHL